MKKVPFSGFERPASGIRMRRRYLVQVQQHMARVLHGARVVHVHVLWRRKKVIPNTYLGRPGSLPSNNCFDWVNTIRNKSWTSKFWRRL